ncbi:MAG: hypothetical protein C4318_03955 [Acidimicrobiia bacterium]
MREVRWNPLAGRHVLFAPGRASRPHDTNSPPTLSSASREALGAGESTLEKRTTSTSLTGHSYPSTGASEEKPCVFCQGNESLTPPEIFAVRAKGGPDEPGWITRVVPNLYPAVEGPGRYHEVVVHSPRHITLFEELRAEELSAVAKAWSARLEAISQDPSVVYFQAGLNQGGDAGASRDHSHSQLLAVNFEPPIWKVEKESLQSSALCPLCELVKDSLTLGQFSVKAGDECVAVCPPWAEFPYEILAFPRDHLRSMSSSGDALEWVLESLTTLTWAIGAETKTRSFNAIFHTGLARELGAQFHWHAHLYPRIAKLASVELGTGVFIQTVDPLEVCSRLRSSDL